MDFETFSNMFKLSEKINVEDFTKMFDINNPFVKEDFINFLGKKSLEKFDKEKWKELFGKFVNL
jgi:hypothetical protein